MRLGLCATALIAVSALTGCGGSDDAEDSSSSESPESPAAESPATGDETVESDPESSSGTVELSDGTTYTFAMSTCDTSGNSDKFLVEPGFDLFGTDDSGVSLQLIRAGMSEDSANPTGSIEGDGLVLGAVGEEDVQLLVDGGMVSGTLVLSDLNGDSDVEATVDIVC